MIYNHVRLEPTSEMQTIAFIITNMDQPKFLVFFSLLSSNTCSLTLNDYLQTDSWKVSYDN